MNIFLYLLTVGLFLVALKAIANSGLSRAGKFFTAVLWWIAAMFILMAAQPSEAQVVTVRPDTSPYSLRADGLYQSPYSFQGPNHAEQMSLPSRFYPAPLGHRTVLGAEPAPPSRLPGVRQPKLDLFQTRPDLPSRNTPLFP